GGGGLGILAADTRRVAEDTGVPFALITPFYPYETTQKIIDSQVVDEHIKVDYKKFGFKTRGRIEGYYPSSDAFVMEKDLEG
ncbi:MAG: hypothetical protein IIV98_00715, partial [Aeriscardovia sp.]|nr:hypothetical protein [Aeriscardovia sp.]